MKKKILVIEDDKILQKAVKEALDGAGLEVIIANDGEDGFKKVKSIKPDLVLLDLILPKMSGEEVLKKICESKTLKKIPVIVFSVKSDEANIRNCIDNLGARDYLVKSEYSLEDVVKKVKEHLK